MSTANDSGEQTPSSDANAAVSASPFKGLADMLGDLTSSAKAGGVLLSAGMLLVIRTAYDSFAATLGVATRDLGYGQADLIEQAGFSLIFLSSLAVLVGVAAAIVVLKQSPRIRRFLAIGLIALWAAPIIVALAQPDFVGWVTGPALLIGMGALTYGVVGVVISPPAVRPALAILVSLIFVTCSIVLAREWGRFEARRLVRGELSGAVGPFGIVRFVAEPICLSVTTNDASGTPYPGPTSGLLLGRTSQVTAVLDGSRVLLIPSANAILFTRSGRECPKSS